MDIAGKKGLILRSVTVVFLIFIFFFSIKLLGAASAELASDSVQWIFSATSNPFIGLFIGILITAILQSSSTTTSMAVALVSVNSLELTQAIPIVIGANIGTTITSSIVSVSYVTKAQEFRKAISAGTVHDMFNVLVAFLLFPLELKYNVLTNLSVTISQALPVLQGASIKPMLPAFTDQIARFFSGILGPAFVAILAFIVLLSTVKLITYFLYSKWGFRDKFESSFFNRKYKSFGLGLILTSIVQSSSLTTSLMVPMVATGKLQLKRAFEFIIGSNLGTTITALIAALFSTEAAIALAIAHFLFNFFGAVIFLFVPIFATIPTIIADYLGKLTLRFRMIGIAYVFLTFFVIPFTLIYFNNERGKPSPEVTTNEIRIEKPEVSLED